MNKRKRKTRSPKRGYYLVIICVLLANVLLWMGRRSSVFAVQCQQGMDADSLCMVSTNPVLADEPVRYLGMTLSFNPDMHLPNWVAWELTADKASGTEPRSNSFASDRQVDGCAVTDDYRGSGYDRGHMAPAADMKWDSRAMEQSFLLTNICPQEHSLNAGSWKKLEEKCRLWAMADSAIYIVAGPVLTDTINEYIGETGVAVPQRFFKVIASPYGNPPRGIGFIMPNSRVPGGMQACAMTIDQVEAVTGHDFFSSLPDEVETVIESQCRLNHWPAR